MARINLEDSLWTDPQQRFTKFCIKIGDEEKALGAWVLAVKLAQKYWFPDKKPVPLADWEKNPSRKFLLECGLAERKDEGVYIKGSEEKFAWLFQKKNAGKASGKVRKTKKERTLTGVQRTSTDANVREPLFSSLSSPSSSLPTLNSKELKARSKEPRHDVSMLIAAYVKAYQERTKSKSRPDIGGKVRGQMIRYLNDVPIERACELIQVYFQVSDPWFEKKHWDFTTFVENQNKIALALDTGRQPGDTGPGDYSFLAGASA